MTDGTRRIRLGGPRRWERSGSTWATGSVEHQGRRLDAAALAALVDRTPLDRLTEVVQACNGLFACARETPSSVVAVADHVRSVPLYTLPGSGIVADDARLLAPDAGPSDTAADPVRCAELLLALQVSGPDTVWPGVGVVQAGTLVELFDPDDPRPPRTEEWFAFRPNVDVEEGRSLDTLVGQLDERLMAALERTIEVADGRTILLPLSGGFDSRVMTLGFRRLGVDDVICFTYGRPGNSESEASRAVAERVGYRWEMVPYTVEGWRTLATAGDWDERLLTTGAPASAPNIGDLPAVLELERRGLAPPGSLFVPGHTGFFTGAQVPSGLRQRPQGTRDDVVDQIWGAHYGRRPLDTVTRLVGAEPAELVGRLRHRIDASVTAPTGVLTPEQLVSAAEEWNGRERQTKFVLNAVRVYDVTGHEFDLPLCDRELVDFWARVPMHHRVAAALKDRHAEWMQGGPVREPATERARRLVMSTVKQRGVDATAKRALRRFRGARAARMYHEHPLRWFAVVDEATFRAGFTGREHPASWMAERQLDLLVPGWRAEHP